MNLIDDLVFQTAKIFPGPLMIVLRRSKLLSHGSVHIADDGGFLGKGKSMYSLGEPLIPCDPVVSYVPKLEWLPVVDKGTFAKTIILGKLFLIFNNLLT